MKKKLCAILVILILLLNITTVFAEDEEQEIMKAGSYKFTIDKFAIRLYPISIAKCTENMSTEKCKEAQEKEINDIKKYIGNDYSE